MKRDFDSWISTFCMSLSDYKYYTDFEKVYESAKKYKIEINILNSLVGSSDIEKEFEKILKSYPECLKVIPLLLAVRENELFCQDANGPYNYRFKAFNQSIEQYKYFMRETGLFNLLQSHIVSNLYDYVTGIEVGLDSNSRKNRSGKLMENTVEKYILSCGFVKDNTYFKEMSSSEISARWNVDLSAISNKGKTKKKFDFVIKTKKCIYLIEVNYYSTGGSKPNETARSYKTLALEAKTIDGVKFVWFTDGGGWNTSRNNLEETFDVLDDIYCINDIKNGVMKELFI